MSKVIVGSTWAEEVSGSGRCTVRWGSSGEIQIGGEADGDRGIRGLLLSTGCRELSRQPRIKTAILTFLRKPPSSLHTSCFTSFH